MTTSNDFTIYTINKKEDETEKAWQVSLMGIEKFPNGDKEIWLPKSLCKLEATENDTKIKIPNWIVKKRITGIPDGTVKPSPVETASAIDFTDLIIVMNGIKEEIITSASNNNKKLIEVLKSLKGEN